MTSWSLVWRRWNPPPGDRSGERPVGGRGGATWGLRAPGSCIGHGVGQPPSADGMVRRRQASPSLQGPPAHAWNSGSAGRWGCVTCRGRTDRVSARPQPRRVHASRSDPLGRRPHPRAPRAPQSGGPLEGRRRRGAIGSRGPGAIRASRPPRLAHAHCWLQPHKFCCHNPARSVRWILQ